MADEQRYEAVKKRVAEVREFYSFLLVAVVASVVLPVINLFVASDKPWSIFFVGGLLFVTFMYASATFGAFGLLGKDWEERKIAELMGESEKPKRGDAEPEEFFEATVE